MEYNSENHRKKDFFGFVKNSTNQEIIVDKNKYSFEYAYIAKGKVKFIDDIITDFRPDGNIKTITRYWFHNEGLFEEIYMSGIRYVYVNYEISKDDFSLPIIVSRSQTLKYPIENSNYNIIISHSSNKHMSISFENKIGNSFLDSKSISKISVLNKIAIHEKYNFSELFQLYNLAKQGFTRENLLKHLKKRNSIKALVEFNNLDCFTKKEKIIKKKIGLYKVVSQYL